jgi:hypothetical protein
VEVLRELVPELDEVTAVTVMGVAFGGLRAAIMYCRAQRYDTERTRQATERALVIVEQVLASVPAITSPPGGPG